jgi:uncharacterized membrane protein
MRNIAAMEHFIRLIETRPLIALHLSAALLALGVGAVVLARRKGTASHKALGWFWTVLMFATALSSVFIRDYRLPNLFGYTPIHLFTVSTALGLPYAIVQIRRGQVEAHRRMMRGVFIGGCVIAGLFALLPSRFLGSLVWKHVLGLLA